MTIDIFSKAPVHQRVQRVSGVKTCNGSRKGVVGRPRLKHGGASQADARSDHDSARLSPFAVWLAEKYIIGAVTLHNVRLIIQALRTLNGS